MWLLNPVYLATPAVYNLGSKEKDFPEVIHLAFTVWETHPDIALHFTSSSELQVLYNLTHSKI
jgi:hypothetical protein